MRCAICDDTGWKPVEEDGISRVARCDCWKRASADRLARAADIPPRYEKCDLDNFHDYNDSLSKAVGRARRFVDEFPVVDRGLLFLAPGVDRRALLEPLGALVDSQVATEVFVATDGETLPVGPTVTALGLPPDVSPESTWIVRFGEAPPYALVAGAPRSDGARPVFHTIDAGLVEHLAFRLRAEIGFGVRG